MHEITIFKNPQFGEIRTAMSETNDPLFCLVDLCKALGIANSRNVKARLDEDDVRLMDAIDNLGRTQQIAFVTESGMYDVILRSDAERAKPFRKWVTSEVLPAIRKHGAYATGQTIENILADPDNAIKVFQALKDERELRRKAETRAMMEAEINKMNAPKVLFAEAVAGSRSTCLIGELAKMISQNGVQIGQNRLFEWMRENDYLGSRGEQRNIPHQRYIEMGLFELKKGVRSGHDGVMKTTITPKVTGKGQQYFINKFLAVR